MAKFVLIVLMLSGLGCVPAGDSCAAGCTGANGDCMSCSGGYSCNSGGSCSAVVNGVACCTGGGGSQSCNPGYCYSNGACCPQSAPWYDRGGHGYGAGCYASCPYVGDCGSTKICY
jgi:hypothetical protein